MSTRFPIAATLFVVVQSVAFSAALLSASAERATMLLPWATILSVLMSGPIFWTSAPRMRLEHGRQRRAAAVSRR